jgi:citrate lyase subunit beta/citryl-CoA lyase
MAGRWPEEFREGEGIRHAITRTVTEADNVSFPVQTIARKPTPFGAVAAEVQPVDTVWTDIRDLDGHAAECRAAVSPASARSIRRRCR